jgi:hypothetical protein
MRFRFLNPSFSVSTAVLNKSYLDVLNAKPGQFVLDVTRA